ncbi:methyltransferase domain protein [Ceratobasidium sp. AG-Ba]|nr:methyltransferase domain protein [Ceratobasidium sp. AG-Ba]
MTAPSLPFPLDSIYFFFEGARLSFVPTLRMVFSKPSLLLHPHTLSKLSFSYLWNVMGPGIDSNSQAWKHTLLYPNAEGIVLDVGAGHGHTMQYLDKSRVSRYVAIEPNEYMHEKIREMGRKCGFDDDSVVIIGFGAEETDKVWTSVGGDGRVDTIVAIRTLCSVKQPQKMINRLVREVLRPGGQMLWCEHVKSPFWKVQLWQRVFSPIWGVVYDGCRLGQDTVSMLLAAGPWSTTEVEGLPGEEAKGNMLYHKMGRFVKA